MMLIGTTDEQLYGHIKSFKMRRVFAEVAVTRDSGITQRTLDKQM